MEKEIIVNGKPVKVCTRPGSIWGVEMRAILSLRSGIHISGKVWHSRPSQPSKPKVWTKAEVLRENVLRGLVPPPFTVA